jgi:hypothetical protein
MGHQRVASIVRYINGVYPLSGLAVLREYRGLRYIELPPREQRFLNMRTLRTILISIESAPNMKFEIYERLNTGSLSLNAQELRNSIYRGSFNDMLHELANFPSFRALIGTRQPRRRMVDEEAILRFFAMRERIGVYRTPLKKFLNEFMGQVRNSDADQISEYTRIFHYAVHRAATLLGNRAFRVLDRHGEPIESAVNRALLEAQLLSCSWLEGNSEPSPELVKERVAGLFRSEEFLDSVQRATGDRARTLRRAQETVEALRAAGASVVVPHNLAP